MQCCQVQYFDTETAVATRRRGLTNYGKLECICGVVMYKEIGEGLAYKEQKNIKNVQLNQTLQKKTKTILVYSSIF